MCGLGSWALRRWLAALLGVFAVFAVCGGAAFAASQISGRLSVVDADTFDVGGVRVRLHAVDAPEMDQTCITARRKDWECGLWVTRLVTDRYDGALAVCTQTDVDRYGRRVARCEVGGEDLAAWMVREGYAFAYVEYGRDYEALEREAMEAKRGLHRVTIARPSTHRAQDTAQAPEGCPIKGNVSWEGERIYHVPGQVFYDRTRISAPKGERWFCSEAAAVAAGWRAALR